MLDRTNSKLLKQKENDGNVQFFKKTNKIEVLTCSR